MIDINEIRYELYKMGQADSIEYVANKLAEARIYSIVCAANFGREIEDKEEITNAIIERASEIEDEIYKKALLEVLDRVFRKEQEE